MDFSREFAEFKFRFSALSIIINFKSLEYVDLLSGTYVVTPQRDDTHAASYTHELTLGYSGSAYSIIAQTSDYDNHDVITYTGAVTQGGEWTQNYEGGGLGDHEHIVVIDDSTVWPEDPS